MKRVLLAALVALVVLASTAHADEEPTKQSYRAVVDRVDLEPSTLTGFRLRVYLTALALEGKQLDLTDPKLIKLYIGSSEKKFPYALGTYGATQGETAIVIMVQTSIDYTEALPMIAEAIDRDLLAQLSDRTQVAILSFGESTGTGKLASIKSVRGKVAFATDNSAGDPTLLDTLDRALMLLKKAKTTPEGRPLRKIVVVVGDGRDLAGDRDRVTRTGTRAAKEGVRIHSMAYSANDARRPMLALGELSKRSFGTFRWVRTAAADSWKNAFEQLRDEISKQYVLTYFVGANEELEGKKLHVATDRTQATSNEVKVPSPSCGGNECRTGYCASDKCIQYRDDGGRGFLGWLLIIVIVLVGGALVLGLIGYLMSKKQQVVHPGVPGQPPVAQPPKQKKQKKAAAAPVVQPGLLPNGRPIPALLITSGPRTGERHMLFNGFLIGKQPGCNLIIEDGYTSSQHAQIGMDINGVCKLYDRGSTNGTYVNGVRITESPLQHGLVIKIGSTEMRFLAE
ncbi:MAG TPA: FHA domain-containing protein [Kofleriaceae bacterium]